jgi:hypothetical protein
MGIDRLTAAQLSDGRLQVWASKDGELFTLWKTAVDPDSGWTGWQSQRAGGIDAGAAAPLPNGALHLFVRAGSGVETTFKLGSASTAGWSTWHPFIEGLGPQAPEGPARVRSVAAMPLSDGRIQVFAVLVGGNNLNRLLTRWKAGPGVSAAWTPVSQMGFVGGTGIHGISAGRLSDGRVQLFATAWGGVIYTSWKVSTNSASAWQPWQPLGLADDIEEVFPASLPDGRMQLWLHSPSFISRPLMTCWKATTDSSAAWTVPIPFASPSPQMVMAFAAAPLSDGRLQLFCADEHGAMFSSWKETPHPDAAWTPWASFPAP